ncbi:hypothetical protein Tco_0196149 [Tanacetum coccineum]
MLRSDTVEVELTVGANERGCEIGVKLVDTTNEVVKEELQDSNITDGAFVDEMPPSDAFEGRDIDDDAIESVEEMLQDISINEKGRTNCRRGSLPPSKQVSDMELENTMDQNPDDGFLQVNDENAQDELQKVETQDPSKGDTKDLMPSSIVE